ncbi:hypothetical protein POM88_040890 [Heracleum sosnowskyi]|uniref:Uncharacterized protein n=1 Tax=Heracleum sosnowskyi TaxID=360622 RepID=A0AAD8MA68_9APIA|nr:hypothetical protein POM88_040890 [Heracleum sosnowskyi]
MTTFSWNCHGLGNPAPRLPIPMEEGHGTDKCVEIRLDRAVASSSWLNLFKDAKLVNLEVSTSDHSPILLEPVAAELMSRTCTLKFENAWLREPVCKFKVEDSWKQNQNETLQMKLSRCLEDVSV